MRADPRFLTQPPEFWANVRTISQEVGYTARGDGTVKVPSLAEIRVAFAALGLSSAHISKHDDEILPLGQRLFGYFAHRANVLNNIVQHDLLDKAGAERDFNRLKRSCGRSVRFLSINKRATSGTMLF